jgi:MFS family permease
VTPAWRQLTLLSIAELFALSLWFSASAVLPALTREWDLSGGGAAGLTIAVQAGFITGTLASALFNLPDVFSARRVLFVGIVLGAAANGALALWASSLGPGLALRFATGVCLAGAYPPAMKIMATWFREGRGLAIGILVGALTVGSAIPHLIPGLTELPWRGTLLTASALALIGAAIVQLFVVEGPHGFPAARFDARMAVRIFGERGPRLACFGYLGHMWELYAMWA